MGSLNATHFKPLSRKVYSYYHQLALQRMQECSALAARLSEPEIVQEYEEIDFLLPTYSYFRTDVSWCEKEAMAYEMHAQHFLQDSWSTGHMWKRWGTSELADFPFVLPDEVAQDVPISTRPARTGALALSTALFSGMIHGTRALLEEEISKRAPLPIPSSPFEDALSSPEYTIYHEPTWNTWTPLPRGTRRVQFVSGGSGPFPGVGDLYFGSHVVEDPAYEEQHKRLLTCAAASMRQVYLAGPQSHGSLSGAPDSYLGVALDSVDVDGDECFGQWVTNQSMKAAWGVSSWGYVAPGAPQTMVPAALKSLVWQGTKWLAVGKVNAAFPSDTEEEMEDKDIFFSGLEDHFNVDALAVLAVFQANEEADPDGTESAELQIDGGGPLRFLGVDPNFEHPGGFEGGKPSSYADDHHQGGALGPLQRIFSRGRGRELCNETAQDAPGLLALRDRCVQNSGTRGGEFAACTACMEVASMHIPMAPLGPDHEHESRCETLGGASLRGVPSAQPMQWWYDYRARILRDDAHWAVVAGTEQWDPAYTDLIAPESVAMTWCSGTASEATPVLSGDVSSTFLGWIEETDTEVCPSFLGPQHHRWGHSRWRYAALDVETEELFPDLGVVEIEQLTVPNPHNDRCASIHSLTTSNYDNVMLSGMPFLGSGWAKEEWDARLLNPWPSPELAAPHCGRAAREVMWNIPCEEAIARYPSGYFDVHGYWGEPAVLAMTGNDTGCWIREPVTLQTCPEAEDELQCDAAGRCQRAPALWLE